LHKTRQSSPLLNMKKEELESSLRQVVYSVITSDVAYIFVKVDSYGNTQGFYFLDPKSITFDRRKNVYVQKWSQVKDIIIPAENVIEITKKGFPDVKVTGTT